MMKRQVKRSQSLREAGERSGEYARLKKYIIMYSLPGLASASQKYEFPDCIDSLVRNTSNVYPQRQKEAKDQVFCFQASMV